MTKQICPIIGLAGGIGSGKSTITSCFHKLGIQYVDADDVARLVVKPQSYCLEKIVQRYGKNILLNNGELDRAALRHIIFNQSDERAWLESLTHPAIKKEITQQLNKATSDYALLVHPLLFETKQHKHCKFVIAIDVPEEVQIQRVMQRDNTDAKTVKSIMAAQLKNQKRLQKADLVFENSSHIDDMSGKVLAMHNKIIELIRC